MNNDNGSTIIEIAVTMLIVSIAIGLAFYSFNRLTKSSRSESSRLEASMDKVVGLELLRLDIEHAGLGLGRDETCPAVRYIVNPISPDPCGDNSSVLSNALILRSTLNNSNSKTIGWISVDCQAGDAWINHIITDERKDQTVTDMVFLDYRERIAFSSTSGSTACPLDAHYIGYPVDSSLSNFCLNQVCTRIIYKLSSNQNLSGCATGTKNLLRTVGDGTGTPILNCVADFKVRFGLDTDGDGAVDNIVTGASLPTAQDTVRDQLKFLRFYALVQTSDFDPNYNFNGNVTIDSNVNLDFSSNCTECSHYHWKVIKKTIKFMDL